MSSKFLLVCLGNEILVTSKEAKTGNCFFLLSLNLPKEAVITIEHIIDYDISLFWVFYPNLTERPKIKKPSLQHDISNWVKQNVSPYFLFIEIGNFGKCFYFFHQPWYASSVDKSPLETKVTVLDLKNSCLREFLAW